MCRCVLFCANKSPRAERGGSVGKKSMDRTKQPTLSVDGYTVLILVGC